MLAMWVKVRVKPGERERFLKAIEVDALGSERDKPGCLRFNVLQDARDQNVYLRYTATKRRWRRIAPHRITPSGARRATPSTAQWRRRAPTPSFPPPPATGSKRAHLQGERLRRTTGSQISLLRERRGGQRAVGQMRPTT